ncbi:MAG TPA: MupA/Atu3671 family FMN-dependent luciferase-like monooxygenase [Candidatus Acidoferrum sp.]|nr:MupA/Atu3671 family FMN-dependent luciferase-like monooxygenase [Candidatus Acidoferrum sp.]
MSTKLHELIEENLRRALGLTSSRRVDPDETFDRYGLDSISGFRLARLLTTALGVEVGPRSIAEHPTISSLSADLAACIAVGARPLRNSVSDARSEPPPVRCVSVQEAAPLPDKGVFVDKLLALCEKSPQLLHALRNLRSASPAQPSECVASQKPLTIALDPTAATTPHTSAIDFGFIFFSSTGQADFSNQYEYVSHIAKYADSHGFSAVWIPERHFLPFGGRFPDPGMLLSYLAAQTQRLRLRSGSVVLPLHHPARIAESWSMLDNLSGGRVDMAFASGWNVNDFVLSPDTYATLRETWIERIALVKRLWRGEAIEFPNGQGQPKKTAIYPRPIQPELNVWMTVTSKEESFIEAGRHGYNVLTMLQSRSAEQLGDNIAKYRRARLDAGFDPDAGSVSLMLHTYVHPDEATVARTVQKHFLEYITSALRGHIQRMEHKPTEAEMQGIAEHSFHHQYRNSALFGDVEHCARVVQKMRAHGVNEIACLVDFGPSEQEMYETLPFVRQLMHLVNEPKYANDPLPVHIASQPPVPAGSKESPGAQAVATSSLASSPAQGSEYAIVGLSGRYPDAANLDQFWKNLIENKNCVHEIDALRLEDICASRPPSEHLGTIRHFALLDNIYRFDAGFFGLSRREATVLDPHMRLLLEEVWLCIENAGYAPRTLAGSKTGIFISFYNYEYASLLEEFEVERSSEPYLATATAGAIMANRISYMLGLRGPSEVYNTACSSSLVALHRALQSIAAGDCDQVIVAGVNLLLTGARVRALSRMGILSEGGICNPFSYPANGEILGEGAGAVMLRPLGRAIEDGNFIYAVISGTDVGHPGSQSGSLTMPSAKALSDLMTTTYGRLGVDKRHLCYIEGHGAGSVIDAVELSAYQAFLEDGTNGVKRVPVGSVKSNIGFGEGSGGLAQLTKCALALNHSIIPASLHFSAPDPSFDISQAAITIQTANTRLDESPVPQYASVIAYGLGGSTAHVVMRRHRTEVPVVAESEQGFLHPLAFSASSPDELARLVELIAAHLRNLDTRDAYIRLCGGESGVLKSMALSLGARDRKGSHRAVILARSVLEFLQACEEFLSGTIRDYIVTATNQPAFPRSDQLIEACFEKRLTKELAVFWTSGINFSWVSLYDRSAYQTLPLPSVPFGGEQLRLPRKRITSDVPSTMERFHVSQSGGGKVVEIAIRSDDYFISQHIVDGKAIMPATGYLGLLSAVSREVFGRTTCSLKGVTWVAPFDVNEESVLLRLESDRSGRFRAYRVATSEKILCCSGRMELAGEPDLRPRLDPSAIDRAAVVLDREAYWALADSEVSKQKHGPILRRIECIIRAGEQLIAILKPPAVKVRLPEIAWLDAALGVTIGFPFVEGLAQVPALAFSLESFAFLRAFPVDATLYAVATRCKESHSQFDISIEDTSGVYAALHGFSVRSFDQLRSPINARPSWDALRTGIHSTAARGSTKRLAEGDLAPRPVGTAGAKAFQHTLKVILGEFLKIGPNAIPEQEDLRSLGLDSIGAHELATQLGKALDIDILPNSLLEHRTIREISRFLAEVYGDRVPSGMIAAS